MYIKYDDLDLLELFHCEPISLVSGNFGDGEVYYSTVRNGLEITLFILAYQNKITFCVSNDNSGIFNVTLYNITSMERSDIALSIKREDEVVAVLHLGKNIYVTMD